MALDPNHGPPDGETPRTNNPSHPPYSVVRPGVRTTAVFLYVGGILAMFVIVGLVMLLLMNREPGGEEGAVGTVGQEQQPGGFEPHPEFGTTSQELEHRGEGLLGSELRAGQPVELNDVRVESTDPSGFWIRDGDRRIAVTAPDTERPIGAGTRVNVVGTVDSAGPEGTRIRASRVEIR